MKFLIALLISCAFAQAAPVQATMLVGQIQYRDVEGRIGVRINHSGRVFKVHPKSPADAAGIVKGDVITSVDGRRSGFVGKIHGTPGTFVQLTIRRNGEEVPFRVERIDMQEIKMLEAEAAPLLVQR